MYTDCFLCIRSWSSDCRWYLHNICRRVFGGFRSSFGVNLRVVCMRSWCLLVSAHRVHRDGYRREGMRSVPSRIRLGSIHYASAFPHVACALAEIHLFGYGMIVPRTAVCGQHLNHLYTKNAHYPGHVLGYILLVRSLYNFSRIHLHLSMYVLRAHISVVHYNYIKCTSYFHNI